MLIQFTRFQGPFHSMPIIWPYHLQFYIVFNSISVILGDKERLITISRPAMFYEWRTSPGLVARGFGSHVGCPRFKSYSPTTTIQVSSEAE